MKVRLILIITPLLFSLFTIIPCKSENKSDKVYKITEAYLIEETGVQHDIMKTILDNNAFIYNLKDSLSDSLSIIVSAIGDKVFIIGKGINIENKETYMKYVEYKDENGKTVSPDKELINFYIVNAGCGLFKNESISTLVSREELRNTIETKGHQYYFFSFFMNGIMVQLYAYEIVITK